MRTPPRNETATNANLPLWAHRVRRKCTHGSDLSQHHYCAPLLSGVEWSWYIYIFIYFTLVALIPRSTVRTPPTHLHHPSHLVMRHLGQKESKHSTPHKRARTRLWHAYLWRPLLLSNTCKLRVLQQEFMLSVFILLFSVRALGSFATL